MTEHTKRAEERAKEKTPINFTCGVCKKVHPYNEGYKCTEEKKEEVE